jgi:DNA polymerase III epsilon subunit-like protein
MKKKSNMRLCAIDTETTHIDFLKAKAVELTILPLTPEFEPDETIKPLNCLVNPGEMELDLGKEALEFNGINRKQILTEGVNSDILGKHIRKWMHTYKITSIEPLAHNWVYDRVVLRNSLSFEDVESIFYRRAKDSHTAAVFVNDVYKSKGKEKPFKKTNLSAMAEYFGMDTKGAHRALKDCLMSAFVYKNLMNMIKELK